MSSPQRLTQVTLIRPGESGSAFEVTWIDASLAKVGRRVKDEDGNVWSVSEVYGSRLFADVEKQYSVWRRWADCAEPKGKRNE